MHLLVSHRFCTLSVQVVCICSKATETGSKRMRRRDFCVYACKHCPRETAGAHRTLCPARQIWVDVYNVCSLHARIPQSATTLTNSRHHYFWFQITLHSWHAQPPTSEQTSGRLQLEMPSHCSTYVPLSHLSAYNYAMERLWTRPKDLWFLPAQSYTQWLLCFALRKTCWIWQSCL